MKELAAIMRTFDNGVVEEDEDQDKIWVDSAAFDIVISCVIVLNAFIIGLETDVRRASRQRDAGWIVAEVFFLLCFLGEVGLKMYYHTWRWAFNSFSNMLTIFICFMAFIDCTILNPIGVSGVLRMFSMFRIVGISRLYKLIKKYRRLDELRLLLQSLKDSMQTLFWTVVPAGGGPLHRSSDSDPADRTQCGSLRELPQVERRLGSRGALRNRGPEHVHLDASHDPWTVG